MIYELREYKMVMHLQQDFLERFREDLVPGMEKLGFDFLGAWLTYIGPGSHTDLVWLLRWNDLGSAMLLSMRSMLNPAIRHMCWKMGPA